MGFIHFSQTAQVRGTPAVLGLILECFVAFINWLCEVEARQACAWEPLPRREALDTHEARGQELVGRLFGPF